MDKIELDPELQHVILRTFRISTYNSSIFEQILTVKQALDCLKVTKMWHIKIVEAFYELRCVLNKLV